MSSFITKIYDKVTKFLSRHKKPSFVLSHGGLHILVLLVLMVLAWIMTYDLIVKSRRVITQIDISMQDTLRHSELARFQLAWFQMGFSPCYGGGDFDYIVSIAGKYKKKSPILTPLHYKDASLSNIPKLYPWFKSYNFPNNGWMYARNFITTFVDGYDNEDFTSVFKLPDCITDKEEAKKYLIEKSRYCYDSLEVYNPKDSISKKDFLEYTENFLRDNGGIMFHDTMPSSRCVRYDIEYKHHLHDVRISDKYVKEESPFKTVEGTPRKFSVIFNDSIDFVSYLSYIWNIFA